MDVVKAAELFKRAALQGDSHGENNIGMRYLKGQGVPLNPS